MSKSEAPSQTRIRASKNAIKVAIEAVQTTGLTVHKLCINGSKVEIHTQPVDETEQKPKNTGLEQW